MFGQSSFDTYQPEESSSPNSVILYNQIYVSQVIQPPNGIASERFLLLLSFALNDSPRLIERLGRLALLDLQLVCPS